MRWIRLSAAFLFFMLLLSGCSAPGSEGETETVPKGDDRMILADRGETKYTIVYPTGADNTIRNSVKMLENVFRNYYGVSITTEPDDDRKNDPSEYEILIGQTNRAESVCELDLKFNDYYIGVKGKKVVITGMVPASVSAAVEYFITSSIKATSGSAKGGTMQLPSGYTYVYSASYPLSAVRMGTVDLSSFSLVVSRTASDAETALASGIQKLVGSASGVILPIRNDRTSETEHEILIGKTTRPLSGQYYSNQSPVDVSLYAFHYVNGSMIVVVGGDEASEAALKYFEKSIKSGKGEYNMLSLDGKSFITEIGDTERYAGTDLRLMSNNILMTPNKTPYTVAERGRLLAKVYRAYLPDILCLQEADSLWYPYLSENLGDLYSFVVVAPEGKDWTRNLNPILYRKDLFEVLESDCYKTKDYPFNSEVTWAVLRERANQKVYIIYNIHLLVDSLSPTAELHRQASTEIILNKIRQLKTKYATEYAFVMGDFNAVESTKTYAMFTSEMCDAKYVAEVRSNTTLNTGHTIGSAPEAVSAGARNYDYIMVNGDAVRVMTHDIVTNEFALNGTDHCPVTVDVILK